MSSDLNQERLMEYNRKVYITPPRANQEIPKGFLPLWENKGYIAQIKKNGTNTLIFVDPDKNLTAMGRHGPDHYLQWKPSVESGKVFKNLPGNGWYVINAELMHNKTKNIKDTLFIHDVLVNDGIYLLGTTYSQRYKILMDLFLKGGEKNVFSHFILNNNAWLARNIRDGFVKVYNQISAEEDEGLMLKNPNGLLTIDKNHEWMVKCRKKILSGPSKR